MSLKKGFTLIELLVVISIIALLLSILMPALGKVKDQARTVVCMSNLHQLGLAFAGYEAETNTFPHPAFWLSKNYLNQDYLPVDETYTCNWHNPNLRPDGLLAPYLGEGNVYRCATWLSLAKGHGCSIPDCTIPCDPQFNYTMNGYLGFHGPPYPWQTDGPSIAATSGWPHLYTGGVLKPVEVKRASETVLFTEEPSFPIQGLSMNLYFTDNITFPIGLAPGTTSVEDVGVPFGTYPYVGVIAPIHGGASAGDYSNGKGNVVMVDGHVEKVDPWENEGFINFQLMWPLKIPVYREN